MEPRQITRWEAARFARSAYEVGVRVLGGCCGVESYHIRAMAEELAVERGKSDHDLSLLGRKEDVKELCEEEGRGVEYDNKWVDTVSVISLLEDIKTQQ